MRYGTVTRTLLLTVLVIGSVAANASASEDDRRFIYQWIDGKGGVHITDSLQGVPREYRSRATRIEQPAAGTKDQGVREQAADQRKSLTGEVGGTGGSAGEDSKRFIYQWIDEKGGLHITDSLQNVPKEHRSRATRLDQPAAGEADQRRHEQVPDQQIWRDEGPDAGISFDDDAIEKAEWQRRLVAAKRRLAEAEERHRTLEEEKTALSKSYGSGVSVVMTPAGPVATGAPAMPQEAIDRLKMIEQDMVRVKQEVEAARNEVENIIPDSARKAGIPPGWLREVE